MKANEAPEKIWIHELSAKELDVPLKEYHIEYTRTDAFIEKVVNFLNYKLDDIVAIRVPGTIIPHRVTKQELIEDFRKYMEGD